jgi:hypothetical protein
MFIRALAIALLAIGSMPAIALDASDEGVYAVVHRDGHVTSKHIRLMHVRDGWLAMDAEDHGQPESCPSCILMTSTRADVERFMGGPAPDGMSAECAHNSLMAICRVVEGKAPEVSVQYGFVALTQSKPMYLKLVRLATP